MESDFEKSVREFLARPPFSLRGVTKEHLGLFCEAFTHDSFSNEALNMNPPRNIESYERLEFLGDSILEFLVCEHIYSTTDLREGSMTDYKQDKVCNHMLSERILAKGIDLDSLIRVGGGHIGPGGSKRIEENMRADCFEALLAATYLSFGMDKARLIVDELLL